MTHEKNIETAFVNSLKNATYIKANGVEVFPFGARPDEKDKCFAQVKVSPIKQWPGKPDSFFAIVSLIAVAQIQHDKDRVAVDSIYGDCFAVARGMTAATLSTATGLRVDAVIEDGDAASEEDMGEFHHIVVVKRKVIFTLS